MLEKLVFASWWIETTQRINEPNGFCCWPLSIGFFDPLEQDIIRKINAIKLS